MAEIMTLCAKHALELIISGALGVLAAAVRRLYVRQKKDAEQQAARDQATREGLVCILRFFLIDQADQYTQKGHISVHALETIEAAYKAYSALGGNGMVTKLMDGLRKLPVNYD